MGVGTSPQQDVARSLESEIRCPRDSGSALLPGDGTLPAPAHGPAQRPSGWNGGRPREVAIPTARNSVRAVLASAGGHSRPPRGRGVHYSLSMVSIPADWNRFLWKGTPSSGFEPETTRLTAGGSTRLSYDGTTAAKEEGPQIGSRTKARCPRVNARVRSRRCVARGEGGLDSADRLPERLYGVRDLVEHPLQVLQEALQLVGRDRAVRRRLD